MVYLVWTELSLVRKQDRRGGRSGLSAEVKMTALSVKATGVFSRLTVTVKETVIS